MEQPIYDHNCDVCTFLGNFDRYDIYFCDQHSLPTVIARYGSAGGDYMSGITFGEYHKGDMHPLGEAYRRAKQKNLI